MDKVLADVDTEAVPLMQKAGTTLDGVNANLGNVDQITKDVADITDKIDSMANVMEGAVSTPARKAAAFGAGVQGAVSSFMRRDKAASARRRGSRPPRRRCLERRPATRRSDAADPPCSRRAVDDAANAAADAVGRRRRQPQPRPRAT